ncbi:MAG: monovalent cation/H(+) antiporter subunit G [Desulfurivibrionaceae bacterium]|nr:monovalent cation/H(+) antiporter subunit G [Desulfurivibrionaceae bacterium]
MLDILVILCMAVGLFFFFGTTVGIIRFPDFYTRTHAAGKGDTLSVMLMLAGLALYNLHHLSLATLLVSGKIGIICVVVFIASPTATHAIMDAGYEAKVRSWSRPGALKDPPDDEQDNCGENL